MATETSHDRRLNRRSMANGTKLRSTFCDSLKWHFPLMVTGTAESSRGHLEIATLNSYCLPIEQGISYLLTGRSKHSLKSRTRNVHLLSSFLLLQSLQVFETYRFSLLNCEATFFKSS